MATAPLARVLKGTHTALPAHPTFIR